MEVFVLMNNWTDRHGESSNDIIGVFAALSAAKAKMADDVVNYVHELVGSDLCREDILNGNIDGVESANVGAEFACIDVDGDGTRSEWSIVARDIVY